MILSSRNDLNMGNYSQPQHYNYRFGEGAWDKVAEMLRTFGVNYCSRKTL